MKASPKPEPAEAIPEITQMLVAAAETANLTRILAEPVQNQRISVIKLTPPSVSGRGWVMTGTAERPISAPPSIRSRPTRTGTAGATKLEREATDVAALSGYKWAAAAMADQSDAVANDQRAFKIQPSEHVGYVGYMSQDMGVLKPLRCLNDRTRYQSPTRRLVPGSKR